MEFSVLLAFFLLAIGLALIVAEVFIPSGGVIAALSAVCFAFAGWYAYSAWWESSPAKFWAFIGSGLALIPTTAVVTLWALSKTRLGRRVLLEGPKREEVDPYLRDAEKRAALIGQVGRAVTLMAPGGLVDVGGERHHAVAEGTMLEPGQPVKVVAVHGNRIVVRPAPAAAEQAAIEQAATEQAATEQAATGQAAGGQDEPASQQTSHPETADPRRNGGARSKTGTDRAADPRRHVELGTEPGEAPLDFDIPEG